MTDLFARLGSKLQQLRRLLRQRLYVSPGTRRALIDDFHRLYYDSWHLLDEQTHQLHWLGHKLLKCPLDLWTYQEILSETRPELLIETGSYHGGSALFYASILELLGGPGQVVSIDVRRPEGLPEHPRIRFLTGSSTAPQIFAQVGALARQASRVMVCLDSDHSCAHVSEELRLYSDLVSPGQYLVVEDTNVGGHPVRPDHGPGPYEAVTAFLARDRRFVVDRERERFLLSFNPGGWLKRL